jgi:hypothetical protein
MKAQQPLSKLKRRRGAERRAKELSDACASWRQARDNAYPPGFWQDIDRLRSGDASAAETAIRFLEADPWFTHAGFTKSRLLRRLRRVQLSESQRDRLRDVMIRILLGRSRMEFTDYCRFARKLFSDDFRARLVDLCLSTDESVRTKAEKMLFFGENGRWPGRPPPRAASVTQASELSHRSFT